MDRNFTRCNSSNEPKNETGSMRTKLFGPKEMTLDFIRQFARVYQFEPKLELGLGSFIVN
ncbi:MAG: hypothetical protein LBE79_02565 [Tannerella sp.]|jgi:hypothetical protein|nr:hypothetical protein [Tannerella sp.]